MNPDILILGLGNPGPKYKLTRHNIGFMALDVLAQDFSKSFKAESKFQAEMAEITLHCGSKALLVKPQTYMNLSGESLRALIQKFSHFKDLPLVVLHDEVDIPFGQMRVKFGGGDAGHNGLKSIREHLGHGEYFRVRFGVGRSLNPHIDTATHVLETFTKQELNGVVDMCSANLDIVELLAQNKLQSAQERASKIK